MSAEPAQRRLAAIVFTDVVGYSARMQRDENGTRAQVQADFARLRALCADHAGEVLNSMGDGLLLCFPSVVRAVECALAAQAEFAPRGGGALQHRIGVHLGDVFFENGQVVGDGVNLAARLQTKASPGTVCVSQTVYDSVRGKLPMTAEALGPQPLKNIAEPVPAYLLAPAGQSLRGVRPIRRRPWLWTVGVAATVALAAGWLWPRLRPPPAAPVERSIAVLPFANLSERADNGYFADGVHEELLTSLANIRGLRVISRTSVMAYRDSKKPIRQIAAELNVAYILEGSVRRDGQAVKVTGQLVDARTDEQRWAQSFLGDMQDVFRLQSELATKITTALQATLTPDDRARLNRPLTTDVAAFDAYLKGRNLAANRRDISDVLAIAEPLLEEAVRRDPHFAEAWAELARMRLARYTNLEMTPQRLAEAREALATAERLAPDALRVLRARQLFSRYLDARNEESVIAQRIWELYPNHPESALAQASAMWSVGRLADALGFYRQAQALDPRGATTLRTVIGFLVGMRRFDEAHDLWQRVAEIEPLSLGDRLTMAWLPYWARGDGAELEKIVADMPARTLREDSEVIWQVAQWEFVRGRPAAVVRIWEESGTHWRYSPQTGRFDVLSVAICLRKIGQEERARPMFERVRDQLTSQLAREPANIVKVCDLALTHALLGDRAAAEADIARANTLVADLSGSRAIARRGDVALAHAWLGDKAKAIAMMREILRQPGVPFYFYAPMLRHDLVWAPLQGDPEFEALLADPANNAPFI